MMGLIGLALVMVGVALCWGVSWIRRYSSQATMHTTGVIIDVDPRDRCRGTLVYSDASGKEHRLPIITPPESPFTEGQRTALRYDPDDPCRYVVSLGLLSDGGMMLVIKVLVFSVAVPMIATGLLLFLAEVWSRFGQDREGPRDMAHACPRQAPHVSRATRVRESGCETGHAAIARPADRSGHPDRGFGGTAS